MKPTCGTRLTCTLCLTTWFAHDRRAARSSAVHYEFGSCLSIALPRRYRTMTDSTDTNSLPAAIGSAFVENNNITNQPTSASFLQQQQVGFYGGPHMPTHPPSYPSYQPPPQPFPARPQFHHSRRNGQMPSMTDQCFQCNVATPATNPAASRAATRKGTGKKGAKDPAMARPARRTVRAVADVGSPE